jgi:hypothetical protein
MAQYAAKNQSKIWIWIIVIGLMCLCCCVMLAAAGGFILYGPQNALFQEPYSQTVADDTNLAESVPTIEVQQESAPTPEPLPPVRMENKLLAVTASGLWLIDETTKDIVHLSTAKVDVPYVRAQGFAGNKRYYAYISGIDNQTNQPTLFVLDLADQHTMLQISLNGPNSQINAQTSLGDPPFEAQRAMQYVDSLAWSPDGQKLAFIAAIDADNSDVYLYDTTDQSVTRLTSETSNAASLHWSPDGRFIEFITINSFGTGAGFDMDGIWVYDTHSAEVKLVEQSSGSGEVFLAWVDADSFSIYSWDELCTAYSLRLINVNTLASKALVNTCFSSIDYNSAEKFGIFAVTDFNEEHCSCAVSSQAGTYIFGESVPVNGDNEHIRKFDQVIAYGVESLPQANLFAVYTDAGLDHLYDTNGSFLTIPPEVLGLKPYPAPQANSLWAWFSYHSGKTGLWLSGGSLPAPLEISPLFSGAPAWSSDGQRLYFFEMDRLFYVESPEFDAVLLVEIPGGEILNLVK